MKAKDKLGVSLIVAGVGLCVLAWQMRSFWWGVFAALLLAVGFYLVWTRERDEDVVDLAGELHDRGLGWRIWSGRRRVDGDSDVDLPDFADD